MSKSHLGPLARESTAELIANKLRAAISHGEILPGSQLIEGKLAHAFGVSRSPLREAMQRLTQEGLLYSVRGRGVFVAEVTAENIRDLYLARRAVERAAVAEIFLHDPVAVGAQLVEHLDDNMEFHQVLVSLANSPHLTRMHETLITETRMCLNAVPPAEGDLAKQVSEHRAIAEAFQASDVALVDRTIVAHLEDAVALLVDAVTTATASSAG
ncbi:MAG: GntR family transcriptional regulator [Streptosporangiales bacterium]|nr:GntR family transcriptional regulator [Streptosporangiales bacterium]